MAEGAFRLGYLVGVVHLNVVDPAAMNVQALAQMLHRHGRALDVPARKTHPPRAGPLHLALLIGGRKLPQRKVGGVAFAFGHFHASAGLEARYVQPGELAVVGELRRVEVYPVAGDLVGVSLFGKRADQIDLFGDVVGRAAPNSRLENVQASHVVAKRVPMCLGKLPDVLALAPGADDHFVLALVGVAGEVADIRDVHNVADVVAGPQQHALEDVLEDIRAEVADVGVVVDGRSAGVEADLAGRDRGERLFPAGQCAVKGDIHA